ncbi:MAG: hypothetical protein Q7S89_03135, partial [bacterium]|nr:hypothetical protein [bacterium]
MSTKSLKIKWVDGFKIRNTTDTGFAGYVTSDYDQSIPPGEVWIEDCLKKEGDFFLHLVATEKKCFTEARAEMRKKLGRPMTSGEGFRAEVKGFKNLRALLAKEAKQKGAMP